MSTNPTTNKISRREMVARICAMPEGAQKEALMQYAIERYGSVSQSKKFAPYKFKPAEYIATFLKWSAWSGMDEEHPGQIEILEACARVMLQQEEKDKWEKGELHEDELTVWKPGEIIKNWIRVESGNGIGKTKSSSGILNWFLDCFVPSAIFTFAPGGDQARFTMWSEIRGDREGKGLPGRILETEIKISAKHFAAHRTVSEGLGKGEERLKGKHETYQLFILDEADGISDTVFTSITSMTSGGNSLVIMFANPKSRASSFHRIRVRSYVQTFRISTLYHPNVRAGREVIPGAVRRDFVEKKLENDCEILHVHTDECECSTKCLCRRPDDGHECRGIHKKFHNEDDFTFDLPYPVTVAGILYAPGTIFKPNARFMTDILGITPPTSTDKTVIPVGRYDAATKRQPEGKGDITKIRVGVDAARNGSDNGTVYIRWRDKIWRAAQLLEGDSFDYLEAIKKPILELVENFEEEFNENLRQSLTLEVRIDAAYATGVIDLLKHDDELIRSFAGYRVHEVYFGSGANSDDYDNLVTEMYFEAAESLKMLCVENPPEELEVDLCEREYEWRNRSGVDRKILEPKEKFKKRKKHSPDDGDGFVLACAPDFLFNGTELVMPVSMDQENTWNL